MPFAVLALLLSSVAAAGGLYLSLGLGLKACHLCALQQTYIFALVGVLLTGLLAFRDRPAVVCAVGLPVAVAACGLAGYHVYLELTGVLECPAGIGGYGSVPRQAFGADLLILCALLGGAMGEVKAGGGGGVAMIAGLALGAAAGHGSVLSNPPPQVPTKPYPADQKVDTCRHPFVARP